MSCISKNNRPSWFAPTAAIPPLEAELLGRYYSPNIFMFFLTLFFLFVNFEGIRHWTHRLSSSFEYLQYNHLIFAGQNESPRFEITLKSGAWKPLYSILGFGLIIRNFILRPPFTIIQNLRIEIIGRLHKINRLCRSCW